MSPSPSQAAAPYAARLAELRGDLGALDARSGRFSSLRGLTLLATLALGALCASQRLPPAAWALVAVSAVAFVWLVVAHAVLVTRMAALQVRVGLIERGVSRIAGDLAALPATGERFSVPGHAYAGDLDIFGKSSLFQLVGAVETGPGEDKLAAWLSAPAGAAVIAERHEAVRELAALPAFREDLAAAGVASRTRGRGAEPFLAWAEAGGQGPSRPLLALGRGLVGVTVLAMALPQIFSLKGWISIAWLIPLVAQLFVLGALRPALEPILSPVSSREAPFGRFVALFRLLEGQRFEAPLLRRLHAQLAGSAPVTPGQSPAARSDVAASHALGRLQTLLGFAEVRLAGMMGVIANVVLLWDVFCAVALLGWRGRHGASVRRWIDAMAELEALASLATFSCEHPDFTFPEVDAGPLHVEAEGLGHPLIPAPRRVSNDLTLSIRHPALLITGSNMSGKSTLMRAIGVNAVLALCGAPVCATRFSLAECQVRTSMRIEDSLGEGVSHFYAELGRLRSIVGAVDSGERVLFLLDEVLHGTNSRERNIGAKAILVHLLSEGAIGGVSSHDLALSSLEEETQGHVRNVHFREQVANGQMTFDYRLKRGVVTSSNALRLMKLVGLEVGLPDDDDDD